MSAPAARLGRGAGDRWRALDGTLVSVDISGFTALAERLAARGRRGAEELVTRISSVFADLIAVAERHGGDVLKFRGDALLLLFAGDRHVERACGAASDMQWTIESVGLSESSVGPVTLSMSAGVHTGLCHFFLTALPHRELIVAGPAATRVFELEDLAGAGEIVVSAETAAHVAADWLGEEREDARLLRRLEPGASTIEPPPYRPGEDLAGFVPVSLRDHLAVASGEAEHRQVTVAFVKAGETDLLLERDGPPPCSSGSTSSRRQSTVRRSAYELTWLESDIDIGAIKLYLTAGAPFTSGEDEEGMLRAVREFSRPTSALPLRAGVARGHVFTGDIGASTRRTYAVIGDAVNLAARLTGRAQAGDALTTLDVARTRANRVPNRGRAAARQGEGAGDSRAASPRADRHARSRSGGGSGRAARPRAGARELTDASERRPPPAASTGRDRRRPGHRQVAPRSGVARPRGGVPAARGLGRALCDRRAVRRRPPALRRLVGIPETLGRAEAGQILAPFVSGAMPDLAALLPLLAVPFGAEVPQSAEVSAMDPGRSLERLHQVVGTFLERVL